LLLAVKRNVSDEINCVEVDDEGGRARVRAVMG